MFRPNFELDILSSVNAITGANGDLKLPVITSAGLSPNSTYIVTVCDIQIIVLSSF